MSEPIIQVRHIEKYYGAHQALKGVSFDVYAGEIFGLLGPNGAGKTTTLSILEGLSLPTSGEVHILGLNIRNQLHHIKPRMNVQLQSTSLINELTALEQVKLIARLYSRKINDREALEILDRLALKDKARSLPTKMSGGEKQRLVLALALVNDPTILFLDEPTASLDPHARRALWDVVRELNQKGATIIVTTHYMEEAEALSRRVGIIDGGRLLAVASPYELISQFCGTSSITLKQLGNQEELRSLPGVSEVVQEQGSVRIFTQDISLTNSALVNLASRLGLSLQGLHIQQPTLEDVFISMTGKRLLAGFEASA